MNKRKPHTDLNAFKQLFRRGTARVITATARKGAVAMGFMDEEDILSVVNRLGPEHFYKSMTIHGSHKIWQDVYRYQDDSNNALYIKLQLSPDSRKAVLIQMKKDEGKDEQDNA